MDFGVTGNLGGYYLAEQYRKNAASGTSGGVNFAELAAAKAAEQAAKRKRREEYARLNEESALKRKLMEQEADERYYRKSITKRRL